MSANPIDKNATPNPTGSLEDLFRHHLGEEAAVPPRPMLWDQIDNSLLIRQNETYRRRLAATRWVAAASLLLATLAGTGWWASRYNGIGSAEVASTSRPANTTILDSPNNAQTATEIVATAPTSAVGQLAAANSRLATSGGVISNEAVSAAEAANHAVAGATSALKGAIATNSVASGSTGRYTDFGSGATRADYSKSVANSGGNGGRSVESSNDAISAPGSLSSAEKASFAARSSQGTSTPDIAHNATPFPAASSASDAKETLAVGSLATSATAVTTTIAATSGITAGATSAAMPMVTSAATAETATGQVGLLAARPAALSLTTPTALSDGLATQLVPADVEPILPPAARKWNYGASYTAGVFNPNINFSRDGLGAEYSYNPALGADSPALSEAAATEYRQHLRPGLSQRLALLATRHLAGHWSLRTGAELTQATAKSASTAGFVGEQLYDLGQYSTGPMQTTNFRYRVASIPVELRYANAAKRGWSLYGRLGGAVSALLGVRSEVEGNPEATRTYSLLSAAGPYRRLLASVRGGAGAQFRPGSGNWAFTLGPVAEMSLVSLNSHPAQNYLAQSRPYSFGVEAGVEFGR